MQENTLSCSLDKKWIPVARVVVEWFFVLQKIFFSYSVLFLNLLAPLINQYNVNNPMWMLLLFGAKLIIIVELSKFL
jgi:hypothetical protein